MGWPTETEELVNDKVPTVHFMMYVCGVTVSSVILSKRGGGRSFSAHKDSSCHKRGVSPKHGVIKGDKHGVHKGHKHVWTRGGA